MLCYCMSLYERLVNTGQQLIHNQWYQENIKNFLYERFGYCKCRSRNYNFLDIWWCDIILILLH
jgi:hypothetical protein